MDVFFGFWVMVKYLNTLKKNLMTSNLYIVVELFVQLYSPTKVKTQTEGKKLDFMTLAPA